MASSDTEICNLALRKLREQPIASLTEDSEPARLCNQFYDDALDYLLARHPHNFAMRRQQLAQQASAPAFQYGYAYTLPTDPYCLTARRVWHGGRFIGATAPDGHAAWVVEGRSLLTDYDNDLFLLYTAQVSDPLQFSPTFTEAFSSYLASLLAYPLTRSETRTEQSEKRFRRHWKEHRLADGLEGDQDAPEAGVFVAVRG